MSIHGMMTTATSRANVISQRAASRMTDLITALEVLSIYAGILLYIWRWQFSYPRTWIVLLCGVVASHLLHRDTLERLGLTFHNLRAGSQVILPLATALCLPVFFYGLWSGRLIALPPTRRVLTSFAAYSLWCLFQQYVMQSYFHNRLMSLLPNRHTSSLLVAVMFGAAHIPNPILMIATTGGGFILAEVFARHRSILPLALAQAVGGFMIAALSPASLIHNMRVGPGYFFFGLR
jgi:hypothetical protein